MKKLMTTLSAVAVAFGLYAAGPSDTGTSFEGLPGDADGIAYDIYAEGGDDRGGGELTYVSGETYWVTNATSTLKVKEGSSGTDVRPDQFLKARQQRYLDIKTTLGNPVSRKVYTSGEGATIGSDVNYFDSLVKFTASMTQKS